MVGVYETFIFEFSNTLGNLKLTITSMIWVYHKYLL